MTAKTVARLFLVTASLGTSGGCALVFGIPDLGAPENVARMKARFKATIQAELRSPAPLDWGPGDRNFWRHYLGPNTVEFCGRPANAPPAQRTYQINYYRGSFANMLEHEVVTPAYPPDTSMPDHCGNSPRPYHSAPDP